ncbi:hypothetical protein ALP55_01093 [Pseudomonas coronafaciens pv. oryzae]|nr:hypothetical protein ALP55_01093 [Pseudomonas coronafaciens pv. oryzae]
MQRGSDNIGGQAAIEQQRIGKGRPGVRDQTQLFRRTGLRHQQEDQQPNSAKQIRHAQVPEEIDEADAILSAAKPLFINVPAHN